MLLPSEAPCPKNVLGIIVWIISLPTESKVIKNKLSGLTFDFEMMAIISFFLGFHVKVVIPSSCPRKTSSFTHDDKNNKVKNRKSARLFIPLLKISFSPISVINHLQSTLL